MRFEVVFLLGLFFISSVIASSSGSTVTDFKLEGCNFFFDEGVIGVAAGSCSIGGSYGYFYCTEDLVGLSTLEEGLGCSMGNNDFVLGDSDCCPSGMKCNKTGDGTFKCVKKIDNCFTQDNSDDCEALGCIWFDITNECADSASDKGCGYYTDNDSCVADVFNLATTGLGTELCSAGTIECAGEYFSVFGGGCTCKWDDMLPAGKKCLTNVVATQNGYAPGSSANIFECSTSYVLGECVNGSQDFSSDSSSSILGGFGGGTIPIPTECLEAFNCVSDSGVRNCGEPLIRVSVFSLFSLIVAVGLIGLFYFFKKK